MPRQPTVMIPYPGASQDPDAQDIAVYLRPEANGVRVESAMLKVIRSDPSFRDSFHIIYLANIPGDFIVSGRILEKRYATKIRFALKGGQAFTSSMKQAFEHHFQVTFNASKVVGAFTAMSRLDMSEEELFRIWVPPEDFLLILGQSIKRYRDLFIVNYDIPALLHKNNEQTDSFSLILRTTRPYRDIHQLFLIIGRHLETDNILANPVLYSHVLHYSHGPFEQILDGIGFVYTPEIRHIALEEMTFFRYLLDRGCRRKDILEAIGHPIMSFKTGAGITAEKDLFSYTYENSYEEAFRKFLSRKQKETHSE